MSDLVPNHHADYPQFGGVFGYVAGLTMTVGRGRDGRLIADMADLSADDRVLDIGCGPGTTARIAARRGAEVIGLDPSRPMLRLAALISRMRPLAGHLSWVEGSAESTNVEPDSISVCWSLASVHHWQNLDAGLDQLETVLAPGARFFALEKQSPADATGIDSHGWTQQQADLFASMLRSRAFDHVAVTNHQMGRRHVVVVGATYVGRSFGDEAADSDAGAG